MPIIGIKQIFRNPNCNKPVLQTKPIGEDLRKKLERIKGIGKKIASEIFEEYTDEKVMIDDIENGKFRVGGVNKKKLGLILKKFK